MVIVRGTVVFLDIILAALLAYFAKLSINDRETKTGFAAMTILLIANVLLILRG